MTTPSAGNGKEMTKLESGDASSSSSSSSAAATMRNPRRFTWTGPAIVLGFELLESIAFSGVALNLVVYLGTVLHGTTAFNAAHVDTWNGTTFIVPVIGAFLADSCWGKYNTIVASLLFYLAGLVLLALSAGISPLRPASCEGISCPQATRKQFSVFFAAMYLTSIGTGGVKSALLPFGAEQYDVDGGPEQAPRKQSFFTWFFGAINLGIFVAGTLVSWQQQNVSWALGFGVSALCLLLAAIGFLAGTPWYRMQRPIGHSRAYAGHGPPPLLHRPSAGRCRCQVLTLAGRDASQNDDVGRRRGYPASSMTKAGLELVSGDATRQLFYFFILKLAFAVLVVKHSAKGAGQCLKIQGTRQRVA